MEWYVKVKHISTTLNVTARHAEHSRIIFIENFLRVNHISTAFNVTGSHPERSRRMLGSRYKNLENETVLRLYSEMPR